MKELVFDAGSKSLIFKAGRRYETLLAEAGKTPDEIPLRGFDSLSELESFLVSLSKMISVKEERGLVVNVFDGICLDHPFSVDLETGDVFPEF